MTKEGSYKSIYWMWSIFYSINIKHIDCYCVKGLSWCFAIPSLIFIYSMMGLLIYKYEPLWQEVSVKSLIIKWPLRPVGLFFISEFCTYEYFYICSLDPLIDRYIFKLKGLNPSRDRLKVVLHSVPKWLNQEDSAIKW